MGRLNWIALLLWVCQAATGHAMVVEAHGNTVYASGPVNDDVRRFEEAFAKGGITTVVFVNSPGGDLYTGLRVGRLIADRGYNTVAAGSCISACSIMFMGGKERRFSDVFRPGQTFVGIHGAHDSATKQIIPVLQPQIYAFYKLNMGDKFNSSVMNQALYDMQDAGSLLRVYDPVRSPKTEPYHCVSSQTPRDKCSVFKGMDASSLGVITHTDLVKLDLPAAFKVAPSLFGKPLETAVPDVNAHYAELAQRHCTTDTCKTNTAAQAARPENRAVALPSEGPGLGFASNADSPLSALVRAVYSCNHITGQAVRLCEPELVNQYDVRPYYSSSKAAHQEALAKLKPPAAKFYADEEYGGGFSSASSLRTAMFNDITPQKVDGVATVGTQELARMMVSPTPPVLVDVVGSFQSIPGSQALLHGGHAQDNAAQDAAFEKRFAALLALLAPDQAKPVAFYCGGRSCWLSVNAALRAKKLGYTQVLWYRGGIDSWKAAELPLAPGVLRAVAN